VRSNTTKNGAWRQKDVFTALLIYLFGLGVFIALEATFLGRNVLEDSNVPPLLFLLEEAVDSALLAAIPLYFVRVRYQENVSEMGLHGESLHRNLVLGVVAGLIIWPVLAALDVAMSWVVGEGSIAQPLLSRLDTAKNASDYIAVFASGVLLTPVAEEIFFRGFVYHLLRKQHRLIFSIVLTNLLFFVVHVSPWWFIQIFSVGVLLTLVYEYSRSLVRVIIAHAVINGTSLVVHILGY
jgi:hypothetical protein